MKKTFLIVATFFGIAAASAQSDKTGFEYGVRGGVNFANITTTDDLGSPDGRTSFYAGIFSRNFLYRSVSHYREKHSTLGKVMSATSQ